MQWTNKCTIFSGALFWPWPHLAPPGLPSGLLALKTFFNFKDRCCTRNIVLHVHRFMETSAAMHDCCTRNLVLPPARVHTCIHHGFSHSCTACARKCLKSSWGSQGPWEGTCNNLGRLKQHLSPTI